MMEALPITAFTATTATGPGLAALGAALREGRSGLRPYDLQPPRLATWIGRVEGLEAVALPPDLAVFDCRNNRLAELALGQDGFAAAVAQAVRRWGAARVAVAMGTSTSGIRETEVAFARRAEAGDPLGLPLRFDATHDLYSLARFVRRRLGLAGPAFTVSAACASSGKTFADAQQLIAAGVADAVVVGGVDSLCQTALRGFQSLELLSPEPCRPNDADRDGISIGEAAGFVLVERAAGESPLCLLGYGESSDGYHMSSPHPDGEGARLAMSTALRRAGLAASAIDYVNLHGTGTPANDRAEDQAIRALLGVDVPCSSTKGVTGHTLGAAAVVEAVIALWALREGVVPGNLNLRRRDPAIACAVVAESLSRPLRRVLSNSFGFGGNNCSLIFGGA